MTDDAWRNEPPEHAWVRELFSNQAEFDDWANSPHGGDARDTVAEGSAAWEEYTPEQREEVVAGQKRYLAARVAAAKLIYDNRILEYHTDDEVTFSGLIEAEKRKRSGFIGAALATALVFGGVIFATSGDSESSDEVAAAEEDASEQDSVNEGSEAAADFDGDAADTESADNEPDADCLEGSGCDPQGDVGGTGDVVENADAAAKEVFDAAERASDIIANTYEDGSQIFTMTVVGDGESVATAASTKWYSPRFIVNSDPATGVYAFWVDVGWDRDGMPEADVRDSDFDKLDATVNIVWLDSQTLQVTVSDLSIDVDVERTLVELTVRIKDADGNTLGSFSDDAVWIRS